MQEALVVNRRETRADLARHLDAAILGQPPDAAQQRPQVLAVDVLHRDEVKFIRLTDIPHAAHVGMGDLTRGLHLLQQQLEPLRITLANRGRNLSATVWPSLRSSAR